MSLEQTFDRIATALESIAAAMSGGQHAPVVQQPAQVVQQETLQQAPPVQTVQVAQEAAPVTQQPAQTIQQPVQQSNLPFNDAAGMNAYVAQKYQQLGPEKGAQIGTVLANMGHDNVAKVTPDQYQQFYDAIEAL